VALFKVCIISTEQYTTVLACMDFFNVYSQRTDYLLRLIDDSASWFPSGSMSLSTSNRCLKLLLLQP
jgi:hypothetical protein